MQKKWWKGIKRIIPGALFGSVSVAGINMTVDAPMHDMRIQVDPVINLNCGCRQRRGLASRSNASCTRSGYGRG